MEITKNTLLPYGKYEGMSPESLLNNKCAFKQYKYLCWLFTKTTLKASNDTRKLMSDWIAENRPIEQSFHNNAYMDADNWLIGAGELGINGY